MRNFIAYWITLSLLATTAVLAASGNDSGKNGAIKLTVAERTGNEVDSDGDGSTADEQGAGEEAGRAIVNLDAKDRAHLQIQLKDASADSELEVYVKINDENRGVTGAIETRGTGKGTFHGTFDFTPDEDRSLQVVVKRRGEAYASATVPIPYKR